MASPRDRRSLRQQLAEDDDAIMLSESDKDVGAGITRYLASESEDPGFSQERIPAAQPHPRNTKGVGFEDVPDPTDSEPEGVQRAGTATPGRRGGGGVDGDFATSRASTAAAEVPTLPLG